ncbi:hypothetical protein RJ640_011254 [Escallonia rubra]|uniref:Uncharacterized protein n=1 Tax=Escallonia rubra TaxID=112253 RepID=A0AA88UMX5_9ASTE|nr:hypothetical protein RJ640_011254 [Escallonia rubra]
MNQVISQAEEDAEPGEGGVQVHHVPAGAGRRAPVHARRLLELRDSVPVQRPSFWRTGEAEQAAAVAGAGQLARGPVQNVLRRQLRVLDRAVDPAQADGRKEGSCA